MKIAAELLNADQAYRLLVGAIIPRPIAWITTLSPAGQVNAAPFSAFTFVSNKPPMICVSIGRKNGILKDTAANIARTKEFVVNIGTFAQLDQLHATAREYPTDVSEVLDAGIDVVDCDCVHVPRIVGAPVALECRLHDCLEFGDARTGLHIGEVLTFHIDDRILANGKIDSQLLAPIARLGGPLYTTLDKPVVKQSLFTTPK